MVSQDGLSYQELTVVHFLSNDKEYFFFLVYLKVPTCLMKVLY